MSVMENLDDEERRCSGRDGGGGRDGEQRRDVARTKGVEKGFSRSNRSTNKQRDLTRNVKNFDTDHHGKASYVAQLRRIDVADVVYWVS